MVKWEIVARPEGKPERDPSEKKITTIGDATFESASDAISYIKRDITCADLISQGFKLRPRVVIDTTWPRREYRRLHNHPLVDKRYKMIPSKLYNRLAFSHSLELDKMMGVHYLHISDRGDGKIAYTENPEKGTLDIQTRMGFGPYLVKEFRKSFTDEQIADLVLLLANETSKRRLYVTRSAEEAVAVYLNGPTSCMSKPASSYEGSKHPASVYAGGDLAVAFILDGAAPDDIEHADVGIIKQYAVVARAVVWPDKKLTGRIYGDKSRLTATLVAAGYDADEDGLCGAKIPAIQEDDGSYIMPYLDGAYGVEGPVGGFFITSNDGYYGCQTTSGIINSEDASEYCHYYEEYHRGESIYISDIDLHYSGRAVDSGHAFYCEYNGEYFSNGTSRYVVNVRVNGFTRQQTWSQPAVEEHAFLSDYDDEYYSLRSFNSVEVVVDRGDTQVWTTSQVEDEAFYCTHNDRYYAMDYHESITIDGYLVLKETGVDFLSSCDFETDTSYPKITNDAGQMLIWMPQAGLLVAARDLVCA